MAAVSCLDTHLWCCSDAWLGLLRLPLPSHLLKQVLVQLHTSVMPCLPNPLLLADFLTSCLDQGGMLGILALNGIFTLVTKHGLEYPAFYARLYALLQVHTHFHPVWIMKSPCLSNMSPHCESANRKGADQLQKCPSVHKGLGTCHVLSNSCVL